MTAIQETIARIDQLTPVPPIATQMMTLAEAPESSLSKIVDLILNVTAITANLLKTCNSAYLGLNRKVDSVQDAIALVGLNHVGQLAMLGGVSQNLKKAAEGYGLGEGELRRHAVSSAHAAKVLAVRYGASKSKHLIFTAALLKDIGKLILGRFIAFSLEQIIILVHAKGQSFNDSENLSAEN
jgi:HD-like signal output (HDOD) protein